MLAIAGVILVSILSAAFDGYVVSRLWGWFIVPAFGVPTLAVSNAIGVLLVVAMLRKTIADDDSKFVDMILRSFLFTLLVWFTAAIVHWVAQ